MSDKSYNNWHSMSDKALAEVIGAFVKFHRLEQNQTQESLASAAGISRSTLSLLERGSAITLASLIQVLRVLNQLDVMDVFVVRQKISPLALARIEQEKRKRASGKQNQDNEKSNW